MEIVFRKPGRPRAIPPDMEHYVMELYNNGLGYRSITRELEKKGYVVDWTTVRRVIKRNNNNY